MDFPDESNTGVPPGVTLTPSGSIKIDTAGAVVSGLDITGDVTITAPNVTLVNCRVAATSFVGVWVTAPGAVIENCEVISVDSNGGTKGIWFEDLATGGVVRGCDIHDVEDGVYIGTKNIAVTDNYIHDLNSTGFDPHYDGIQLHGGVTSDVTIRHNSIIVANSNSAITMGTVQNVLIDGNLLSGGGYTIHVDGRHGEGTVSGVSITNNRFGSHSYGYMTFELATPFLSGNVDNVTGDPLDDGAAISGSVSINDVTISEGDSGTEVATFTVTRSGGTAAFDVNYATSNATATVVDSDYVAASNTLHFGASENTKTISVTINGDTKVEANETFNVILSNATNGATLSDGQGVGTIINDDVGVIAGLVSVGDVTISEGDSGAKVATFTVTRSGGTAVFDVNFATSNGTATVADSDYVAASSTLHFGANENTQTISVTINGDTKVEANETFNVVLSNATNGATISDSQGVGIIINDDDEAIAGSVSINDVTISEGDSGTEVATFTVTRSGGTAAFDVNFATSNETATVADSDYVAASNTLHFGANENTQTISVTINGDTEVEANETFNVVLSNATNGATISDSQGVGTIINDDDEAIAGSVSINDVTISEGDSGTEVATFTVTRSGGTAAFDVNFATSNETATVVDSDYVAASNTLHFGASENTQTISVTINGDTTVEANEAFNVVLSNATNGAIISDSEGLGTIISDDGEVIVGSDGNDTLTGGDANDVLDGRGGIDTLFGGAGGDTFVFGDKIQADGDTVMDFVHGVDQLDFHLIDAREFRSGDQAFIFDGYSVGDHPSTRLWLTEDQAANVTHVYADTGPTVFRVDLTGTNLGLTASDFIL